MKWITRERPKIDRIACPWLIKNFVDADAEFIYTQADLVHRQAAEWGAIPFDVPDTEYTHYQDKCTFDFILEKHHLTDPALHTMAMVVRGADTDRHDLAAQAAGLWAISAGMAYNISDDYELLSKGMLLYDALYTWAKHLQHVKHTQNAVDNVFIQVFDQFIRQQAVQKKTPQWVKELKQLIQDQIDTSISLTDLSRSLSIHPSYLSREFSKHFDDLSFGEYIRKLRIEKAIQLMNNEQLTLTQIAYLTGFSDQSHFTRIFKQYAGVSPSVFKKQLKKK